MSSYDKKYKNLKVCSKRFFRTKKLIYQNTILKNKHSNLQTYYYAENSTKIQERTQIKFQFQNYKKKLNKSHNLVQKSDRKKTLNLCSKE